MTGGLKLRNGVKFWLKTFFDTFTRKSEVFDKCQIQIWIWGILDSIQHLQILLKSSISIENAFNSQRHCEPLIAMSIGIIFSRMDNKRDNKFWNAIPCRPEELLWVLLWMPYYGVRKLWWCWIQSRSWFHYVNGLGPTRCAFSTSVTFIF